MRGNASGGPPSPGWSMATRRAWALTRWRAVRRSPRAVHADEVACTADGRGRLAPLPGKGGGWVGAAAEGRRAGQAAAWPGAKAHPPPGGFRSARARGPGVVLNNNGRIPTLGPNPAQSGMSFADYVHLHCQNYGQCRSDSNRGSEGCLTVRGDYCQRLWELEKNQCNKNVIVHVIRN